MWTSGKINSTAKQIQMTVLKKHVFMVSTLLKTILDGQRVTLSCDMSGQVLIHDTENTEDVSKNKMY